MTKGSARSWQHKPAWKGAHGASKHPKFRRHPKQEALLSSAVGFAVIPHHSPTAFDGFAPALQVSESATTSKRLMRTVSRRCKSHVFESWAYLPDVTRKIMATRKVSFTRVTEGGEGPMLMQCQTCTTHVPSTHTRPLLTGKHLVVGRATIVMQANFLMISSATM